MPDGKWIRELKPDTPLASAARHVLAVRLEVVCDWLTRALREPAEDPEHIHQLRVATRRARAALDIFADCLPAKAYRAARRQLRAIRQMVGTVRDWDVFLNGLESWSKRRPPAHRPGLDFLWGYASGERAAGLAALEAAGSRQPDDFERLVTQTQAAVRMTHRQQRVFLDLARPMLAGLLRDLDEAAAMRLDEYEHLHKVRIAGKRLRYAMEVFADCFPPPFRETLYPRIVEMQEILGLANDSQVAIRRLLAARDQWRRRYPERWPRYKAGLEAFLRHHRSRLVLERKHFQKWWNGWQESAADTEFTAHLQMQEVAPVPERCQP